MGGSLGTGMAMLRYGAADRGWPITTFREPDGKEVALGLVVDGCEVIAVDAPPLSPPVTRGDMGVGICVRKGEPFGVVACMRIPRPEHAPRVSHERLLRLNDMLTSAKICMHPASGVLYCVDAMLVDESIYPDEYFSGPMLANWFCDLVQRMVSEVNVALATLANACDTN